MDMVGQLNRARSQGVSAAERSLLLDSITAEAGRVRSGREAQTTASVLGKVRLSAARPCACESEEDIILHASAPDHFA